VPKPFTLPELLIFLFPSRSPGSFLILLAVSFALTGCDEIATIRELSEAGIFEIAPSVSAKGARGATAPDAATLDGAALDASQSAQSHRCGSGRTLVVHFYDVGQGLSALVDLPDGRHVLVDAGDRGRRTTGCTSCSSPENLVEKLRADLHGAPIDLLWITHQHSDHIGGAPTVLESLPVLRYVDNGRDGRKAEVRRARKAALERGASVRVVDPEHTIVPMDGAPDLTLAAVVPSAWPPACSHDPNECSIGLRLDFCSSSVFFAGDAEHAEEAELDPGHVTLLQVGHHGSETSSTPAFLFKARPTYAVVSAGRPGEGANREYCHPRAPIIRRLTRLLGGPGSRKLEAFDGDRCDRAVPSDWVSVPASDRLWATERDGDVVLATRGDGVFERR
jgi:competence protein ComEC